MPRSPADGAAATKLEEADTNATTARDRVLVLREKVQRALTALGGDPKIATERHALVREKQALRDRAAHDLSKTVIVAPANGTAVNVRIQPSQQVKAASAILAIVADTRPWVEANLKETDFTHLQPGQRAEVTIAAYPNHLWEAEVESVSPATGAEFAILPPQNATGNWVKIVQRLPVRLRLIQRPGDPVLRAGMTAYVSIDTGRDRRIFSAVGWPRAAARTTAADAGRPARRQ